MSMSVKKEKLASRVLSYLEKNPEAGDTLEGIATWWLEQQRINQVVEEVAEALEYLIQKGIVRIHKTRSGATIYKIQNTGSPGAS